jgi:hypothetical protein
LKSRLRDGTEVTVTFPRKRVMEVLPGEMATGRSQQFRRAEGQR